ncbi:uncharacterized protein BX664DRAFT_128985 [Halteromyces radiatus]|uniref:uncharacterized protein n=1 Tax=Halteromyces radiatus TaxID=101107 RepID=UPI00221EB5AC|nr:uncharacterized protein BX664DRAFT_128985 [Halteromyces radiatus]KAI8089179.1 hypothetical protein BX664DRAFT_128985 [Halteromyces radiatus]
MNLNLKFASNAPLPPTVKFFPHLDRVVTVEHCYYYLSFLERFWTFMDTMTLYEQRHYLARAEVRYEKWLHNFNEGIRVPPLDVAFLWHIHALSPLRYYEDLVLRLRCNAVFDEIFPLDNLHHTANDPHMNDLNIWNQVFGEDEPYFLSPENMYDGTYSRPCYACQQEIVLPWSAYFEYRYGVNTTRFPHDGCGPAEGINFLDVARMKLESDLTNKCPGPIVAGTLLKPNGTIRKKPNKMVTKIKPLQIILPQEEMDYAYERQIQEQLKFFGKKYEYDANELLYAIRTSYQSNPTPFSIDLIHAVSRQRRFYDTIISMDWSSESDILIASIRHYHNFMATLKHQSNLHAVPTVEIDIAFHVHMLCGPQYRKFTLKHLHQVINHDDNIPENYIKEYTARWKRGIVAPPYIYMVKETKKESRHVY